MARQHYIVPQGTIENTVTVRLGASATAGANYDSLESGKFVKLIAESNYGLCAAGDPIEAVIVAVELATQAGWSIGSIVDEGIMSVTCDGLEATPGTGTIAVGDVVVAGTVVARGTAVSGYPKVCKATTPANVNFKWRVMALYGTGAVGQTALIERI